MINLKAENISEKREAICFIYTAPDHFPAK